MTKRDKRRENQENMKPLQLQNHIIFAGFTWIGRCSLVIKIQNPLRNGALHHAGVSFLCWDIHNNISSLSNGELEEIDESSQLL